MRVGLEEEEIHQSQVTGPIVGGAEFTLRGAHAVGDVAVGLARLDAEVTGQHGAGQGDDDLLAGLHVRRAADDAARHLVALVVDVVVLRDYGFTPEEYEALKPGDDAMHLLHLDQPILEINVTPDRGYAFSYRGIAREFHNMT